MGRRKKCEQIKRTNNVMVRFTDAEYASISISAEQAGYPVAVYVRKSALDEHIEVHYNITAELPELQKLIAEYASMIFQNLLGYHRHARFLKSLHGGNTLFLVQRKFNKLFQFLECHHNVHLSAFWLRAV